MFRTREPLIKPCLSSMLTACRGCVHVCARFISDKGRDLGISRSRGRWTSKNVRKTFIDYFKEQGHKFVPSSSVIPQRREGTYFTNAGMNQFKPIFLGQTDPGSKLMHLKRAVNSQKCIRVGGKHNDLDDVGHDLTHHTFFEMLGNWSFGDYFKAEACTMAFELLTKEFKIPLEKLFFTYFAGDEKMGLPADEECREIWASLNIPVDRILPFGSRDNFWDMGLTGPCGPCTEIHFDNSRGDASSVEVNSSSSQVVEIWNLVFMQFDRQADQSLCPLPLQHVDTGMGLERMLAVMTGTADNYNTDLFWPLFRLIRKTCHVPVYSGSLNDLDTAYRILADHSRMLTVAISDGLLPSNDNLGHKLRGIIHRCIRLCREQFQCDPRLLLPDLCKLVADSLGDSFPELHHMERRVADVLTAAVDHYDKHQDETLRSFTKALSHIPSGAALSGQVIRDLEKGKFGQPMTVERISELAHEHRVTLDIAGHEKISHDEVVRSSSAPLMRPPDPADALVDHLLKCVIPPTDDSFKYQSLKRFDFVKMGELTQPCLVQGMSSQGQVIHSFPEDNSGEVVLDKTCFYAEAGGQVADEGTLTSDTGVFRVKDVQRRRGYVVHYGQVIQGFLLTGQEVQPLVERSQREGCMRNHTATHLLNSALLQILPTSQQQGSNVNANRLTFDFLALSDFSTSCVQTVEATVRKIITENHDVSRKEMSLEQALAVPNVVTLQNEDYPENVALIEIGTGGDEETISAELCGGTHVTATCQLDDFCITGLGSKSQNVKRITAVTGEDAIQCHYNGMVLSVLCDMLGALVKGDDQEVGRLGLVIPQMMWDAPEMQALSKDVLQSLFNLSQSDLGKQVADSGVHAQVSDIITNLMSALVTAINKCLQISLLPKVTKDKAAACLNALEHKVSEQVNAHKVKVLQKMLISWISQSKEKESYIMCPLENTSLRLVVKALSQGAYDRFIVCVWKDKVSLNAVLSVPSKEQPTLDFKTIVSSLNDDGLQTKGKLSTKNSNVLVYSLSAKGVGSQEKVTKAISQWLSSR